MDKIRTGWRREFFQAPNEIYERQDISGYAKAVYVYLCRRADEEGRAFPTYGRIAREVGFSVSTVRRAIDTLLAAGLLRKDPRYGPRGAQEGNLYTLVRPSAVPEGCSKRAGGVFSQSTPPALTEHPECIERDSSLMTHDNSNTQVKNTQNNIPPTHPVVVPAPRAAGTKKPGPTRHDGPDLRKWELDKYQDLYLS